MQRIAVGPIQAMRAGDEHGMGFNVTDEKNRPMLSLMYPSDSEAKSAKKLIEQAIKNVSSFVVHDR